MHPFEDVHASSPFIHTRNDVLGLSVNNLEQSKRFTELNLGLVATLAGINNDGVTETESVNVAMYPNPAHESVTILTDDNMMNVSIHNLLGQQIETLALDGTSKCTLDTSDFSSGVYVVKIRTEKGLVAKQLVVY